MKVRLIKLTKAYQQQLGEMIEEWRADQERNHTDRSPGAIFKNDYRDFDYYLEHLERKTATADRVPDSVFFLLDEERDRLLGAVNIRHQLNDALLREGGHIGDGIRPSERRKGYATEMIRLALLECRKLGIDRVLMTCDKDNIGSARSIVKNGGVLENEFVDSAGKVVQRYWITLGEEAKTVKDMIAYCGLDCETCDARLATVNEDEALRRQVAELWTKLNNVEITPEMIHCVGCRIDGVKTPFCESLCPIRQCALRRNVETCGACAELDTCQTVAMIHANNAQARENLKG